MSWVLSFCKGFEGPSQFFPELWPCVFASATLGPSCHEQVAVQGLFLGEEWSKAPNHQAVPGFIFHSITMCEQRDGDLLPPFFKGCWMVNQPVIIPCQGLFPKFRQLMKLEKPLKNFWVTLSQCTEHEVWVENRNILINDFAGLGVKAFACDQARLRH